MTVTLCHIVHGCFHTHNTHKDKHTQATATCPVLVTRTNVTPLKHPLTSQSPFLTSAFASISLLPSQVTPPPVPSLGFNACTTLCLSLAVSLSSEVGHSGSTVYGKAAASM